MVCAALKGMVFINRVSILADFGHFGYAFKKKPLFHYYQKENQYKLITNYVYGNLMLV